MERINIEDARIRVEFRMYDFWEIDGHIFKQ